MKYKQVNTNFTFRKIYLEDFLWLGLPFRKPWSLSAQLGYVWTSFPRSTCTIKRRFTILCASSLFLVCFLFIVQSMVIISFNALFHWENICVLSKSWHTLSLYHLNKIYVFISSSGTRLFIQYWNIHRSTWHIMIMKKGNKENIHECFMLTCEMKAKNGWLCWMWSWTLWDFKK